MGRSGCCWNGDCSICESATCECVCHVSREVLSTSKPLTGDEAKEWSDAADWCAREESSGQNGEPLPDLSDRVRVEIEMCPDEWAEAVRLAAYAQSMDAIDRNAVISAEVRNEGDT